MNKDTSQRVEINRRNSPQIKRSFTLLNAVTDGNYGPAVNVGHGFAFAIFVKRAGATGTNRLIIEARDENNNWATWKDISVPTGTGTELVEAISAVSAVRAKMSPYGGGTFTVSVDVLNVKAIEAGAVPGTIDWSNLTNKPATFTPAVHTHAYSELTGSNAGYVAPTAISAAGNTNIALGAASERSRIANVSVTAGAGSFTHTLTIQNTNAAAGDEIEIRVAMPASYNPLIDVRNLTSGGTQLTTIAGKAEVRVVSLRLRYDGAAWLLVGRVRNEEIISAIEAMQQFSSRQSADYLQSDGASMNRRIETQYGAAGAVAGRDVSIVDIIYDVPTSNPSTNAEVFAFCASNSATPLGQADALTGAIGTTGNFLLRENAATGTADRREFNCPDFRATYSGRRVRLSVAFTGNSATNPVVWVDGVDISASFTAQGAGAQPNWIHSTLSSTYFLQGYNWPVGYFRPGRPVNRKYAQADMDFVQATGRLAAADACGGSMAALTSNFATDTDGFTVSGCTIAANQDGIGGEDNWLVLTANATNNVFVLKAAKHKWAGRYKITGKVFIYSTNATAVDLQLRTDNNATIATFTPVADTATAFDSGWIDAAAVPIPAGGVRFRLMTTVTVGDKVALKDINIIYEGALSDPIIQPCLVLDDATGNNRASIFVGFRPVTTRKDWRIPAWVDLTSPATRQLLGSEVFADGSSQALDTIESVCTGTPTFAVHDGLVSNHYVSSVAHSAGRRRETLANNFPSATTGRSISVANSTPGSSAELIIIRGHHE